MKRKYTAEERARLGVPSAKRKYQAHEQAREERRFTYRPLADPEEYEETRGRRMSNRQKEEESLMEWVLAGLVVVAALAICFH
jgi:hypothetical protein